MKYLEIRFHRTPDATRRSHWMYLLSIALLAGTLGTVSANATTPTLTEGTYISDNAASLYSGGPPPVPLPPYTTPGGINYAASPPNTSQTNTQTNPQSNGLAPTTATATASLGLGGTTVTGTPTSNQLSLSLTGNGTSGEAEMWDTLTFSGFPITYPGSLLAILTMTVTASSNMPATATSAISAWGLETFYPDGFSPYAGYDCALVNGYYQCGYGWVNQSADGTLTSTGVPTATFASVTDQPYTIDIYSDFLDPNDQISYIAAIDATNFSAATISIDPSVTLTYLAPDVTVTSDSGAVYNATAPTPTVPEPGTLALLGFGLAGLAASRRRKQ